MEKTMSKNKHLGKLPNNIEESMANAFKKAGQKTHVHLSHLVSSRKIIDDDAYWDEDEGGGESGSSGVGSLSKKDFETIEAGNEALQKMLMGHETEFGQVSKDRRAYERPSKEQRQGLQQQSGLPHHPLLNTQRFDGMSPNESVEATVNPLAADTLADHLETHPELVNDPKLRAALEHKQRMKAQMRNTSTPTFTRH
jgi:hypothetical protein